MKLAVPYYSQFVDVHDPFWMLRACGACSFKMVVEFLGKDIGDIVSFCQEAKESGGYDMQNGWRHNYLVEKAKALGLQAYRKEDITNLSEIVASLQAGNPVIVSVEKRLLEQKRFHMIVLVGYENNTIIYHESEATDKNKGSYRSCDTTTFMGYFRGKAIFITKNI